MRRNAHSGEKGDMFLSLTFAQLIAALLVFLLVFLQVKRDNAFALRIRGEFETLMAQDWDIAAAIREQYQSVLAREEATDGICIPVSAGSGASQDSGILLTSVTLSGRDAASSALSDTFYNDEEPLMPVNGSVTSDYGYRIHPINGGESFHSGRDIAADEGTDIRAVYDGTVVAVGVGELSGNYVKIDHGDELEALYCHCSAVYVNDGDLIRKGDIIAAVGQTGAATGPHLHFELHRNGEVTDPAELLDQAVNVD